MTITINGTDGITTPEVTLDNTSADGGQVVLKSSGYSNWNLDNYSGRIRAYYGSTEYFTINSSGNVGIGTSSPSFSGSSRKALTLNAPTGQLSILELGVNGALTGYLYSNASQTSLTSVGATPLLFETNGAERARIDSSGNLLVGTTNINIWTGGNGTGFAVDPVGAMYVVRTSNPAAVFRRLSTNGTLINFGRDTSDVGRIDVTTTATTYVTSSDYRLKYDIQPMQSALERVSRLKPVTYKWNADNSDGEGFIAHELAEVCPQAVSGEKDAVETYVDENGVEQTRPVYQGIDTSFLVATLTAAIQEQQVIIESLKTRIETLENK